LDLNVVCDPFARRLDWLLSKGLRRLFFVSGRRHAFGVRNDGVVAVVTLVLPWDKWRFVRSFHNVLILLITGTPHGFANPTH
jgi:hypothetical protein